MLIVLTGGLLVLGALFAQGAFAHSQPIRFDPPPGAVLSAAPAKIEGWFTSPIRRDSNWTFMRVTDAQGNRVDTGETVLSSDRRQMTVNLRPNLPEGRYVVTHRAWDDEDNEIVSDCYTFFVGQAAADAAFTDRFLLSGGTDCERFEVSARDGTPVPGTDLGQAAGERD